MKYAKTSFEKKTYYVKNETIYNITLGKDTSGDACAIYIDDENKTKLPSFVVTEKSGSEKTYYLDYLISDGDMYKNNKFLKTQHSEVASSETTIAFLKIYGEACKKELNNLIAAYPSYGKDEIGKMLVNRVPSYMIKGGEDTLTNNNEGVTVADVLIDLDEFDTYRQQVAEEEAKKAANSVLSDYGYEVDILTIKERE